MISVNILELLWIMVNLSAIFLTIIAIKNALDDRAAVKALNGRAREIVASASVRREAIRLVIQVCLLSFVLPGLFTDDEPQLSIFVVILMAIPVLLLVNTLLDYVDRQRLMRYIRP